MGGNFNANLVDPEGTPRGQDIADEIAAEGIVDVVLHSLPSCNTWLQDMCTWRMRKDGQEIWSRTDYILGTYCRLLQDVDIQDMRHNSDHYMVLGCMSGDLEKELMDYLRKVRRFLLRPIRRDLASASEKIFSELKNQTPNPPPE